ncbi:MAG: DUF1015 family protein [Kiritimatiellae bacterium]|nr:DUF1015 family protein [Kiritimatiellia bacterium]
MRTRPFAALRPRPDLVAKVAAVPYDVVDTGEARAMAAGNPLSFLHVSRPEIDLPPDTDPHAAEVYAQGARALHGMLADGTLLREPERCLYVYRQIMGSHSQTGVVACCHIDDYAKDVIRKHEKTRQDKEDDRTRHALTLNVNSGPVFLTYRDTSELDRLIAAVTDTPPLYDFSADDGIRHIVWRVSGDTAAWVDSFARVDVAYVADGHHRAKAAFRAGCERRAANPHHTGEEEYNWFLAVLFPASHLRILPYNRCVSDLHGFTAREFLARVRERFDVHATRRAAPEGPQQTHMYLAGKWYRLAWEAFEGDPVSVLDVSVLQDRLLRPLLGIEDPRTDTRISFVGGIRGTDELARRVDRGRDAVAFSMYPVTVAEMMAIADAGQIMPPKSTWFEPKLRSGLLVHSLD